METVLFIDDGGVLNDNERRGPQWQKLVGEYLSARLGGTATAWAEANRETVPHLWHPEVTQALWQRSGGSYDQFYEAYLLEWLSTMCGYLGRTAPDKPESIDIAREATDYVLRRVRAAFPGAADAVHSLKQTGYRLFTASGESSWELQNYLGEMGIVDCFEKLYGPDLVNSLKFDPAYYPRIFADAGVRAADAIVIDDNVTALELARRTGARTILVSPSRRSAEAADLVVDSLAAVPAAIADARPGSNRSRE